MAKEREFRVLVATDGSNQAREAIATALHFPWPARTRVRALVARKTAAEYRRSILLTALDRGAEIAAESARRALSGRWPDVEVVVVEKTPVDGILAEADRFAADVIVLGWRGHGPVRRLLMGSVSRRVLRGTAASVLIVRRRQRINRIVVGLDTSRAAPRVLAFLGRLRPPRGGRVTLVSVLELVAVPSRRLVSGAVATEIRRANTIRGRTAMRKLNSAAAELKRKGWRTRTVLTTGEPLRDILRAVAKERAHLLVVGARGTSRVRHLLLGSVAEGALNRCPVPVVVARGHPA